MEAKKSLGQHWLDDQLSLQAICEAADISPSDVVLEIGPGHGSLTKQLLAHGAKVIAIEKDEELAAKLQAQNLPKLKVIAGDVLGFDFSVLPSPYKVVANIPYYLSSHLLRILGEINNPPAMAVLLLQKEVAERVCARQGHMSLLGIAVQLRFRPKTGMVVPAHLFVPPPKVDSQILILDLLPEPRFKDLDEKLFFRIVRAGFGERRKKLRGSLSGGLHISKEQADCLLKTAGINNDLRAQSLSLKDWYKMTKTFESFLLTDPNK